MLLLGSSFYKIPVLSIRSGGVIGKVVGHLINPHKLTVDALWCQLSNHTKPSLILPQDIRETSPKGIVVNDHAASTEVDDAIRLKSIIDLKFELLDKKIISGRIPLGRVTDYALDRDSYIIVKLYAAPKIWGAFSSSKLTFDRSQVIEITPTYIKVKSSHIKDKAAAKTGLAPQTAAPSASSASALLTRE